MVLSGIVRCLLMQAGICALVFQAQAQDRKEVYRLLQSDSLTEVNRMLDRLKEDTAPLANAFRGTLMMRKAHLLKIPGQKLNVFKNGARLLEKEIKDNPEQAEFRFLRLIIQENAPKILNYDEKKAEDREVILRAFGKLDQELKTEIRNYARKSKVLNAAELN